MTNTVNPWPDHDELLLLRAAVLDGSSALGAWRQFRAAHAGIDDLDYNSYGLLPRLSRQLRDLDPPEPALGRMKGVYRHAWYANQQLLHDGARAVSALRDDGIDVMLLKGSALVALYVSDVGLRPMDTIDILVHPRDAGRALDALCDAGWERPERTALQQLMRLGHSVRLSGVNRGELDLHWSALFPRGCDAELWEHAITVSLSGVPTRAPSPTDQLLLACAHGVGWNPEPLRWITDAMLTIRSAGDQVDWAGLVCRAHARRVSLDLADTLGFLAGEFSLALPEGLLADLRSAAPAGERVVHGIKAFSRRRNRLWTIAFIAARRWDVSRRLAAAPPLAAGHPAGILGYAREEWGLRTRRAVLMRAARKGWRLVRGVSPR